jgi:hypothetical protein
MHAVGKQYEKEMSLFKNSVLSGSIVSSTEFIEDEDLPNVSISLGE